MAFAINKRPPGLASFIAKCLWTDWDLISYGQLRDHPTCNMYDLFRREFRLFPLISQTRKEPYDGGGL